MELIKLNFLEESNLSFYFNQNKKEEKLLLLLLLFVIIKEENIVNISYFSKLFFNLCG